jgi:hypothetical protein
MHEGECVVPSDLGATFSFGGVPAAAEYPRALAGSEPVSPEVVAIATSAGGYLKDENGALPVEPRSFNVIVAYDGHLAGVGRVAVDASFHHFLNVNLRGEPAAGGKKKGFYDEADNPTKDYIAFRQYYRNTVTWLCPPWVRFEYYTRLLAGLRHLSPLVEEIRPGDRPTWDNILYAGAITRNAIAERYSPAEATQCALSLSDALPKDLKAAVAKLGDPWLPTALRGTKRGTPFFEAETLLQVVLGGAMLGVAAAGLTENPGDASASLSRPEARGKALESAVVAGLTEGFKLAARALDEFGDALGELSSSLNALR